ncbi:uncharacterized protein LOC128958476 [Oppia nitens]|uniref:uncharacterized protein LOC128958476 n=1 Tax=Oppia nitens TaxID=1686743 RepID=UPI0023DAC2BF|nr:uncharacterized protein LOC128958476 [Oppia nitens]
MANLYANLVFICAILVAIAPGYKFDCKMTFEQLDECVEHAMFIGNRNAIVPTNEAEMDQHCNTIKDGISCARDYASTCVTGFPQQVTGMVLTNVGQLMEKRCGTPKERAEFLENVKCFIPSAEKMKPLHDCFDKNIKIMELASQLNADDPHMAFVCCGHHLFKQCIVQNTAKICSSGHADYWDDVFDEVASEVIAFACGDFDTVNVCQNKMDPKYWSQLATIDSATDPAVWHHSYKTPVKFMLDMIHKFHMDG